MMGNDSENTITTPDKIVTLVHGTWAHDASWVKPGSKLCQHLQQSSSNTLIQSFQWSGNNSNHARQKAAKNLSKKITETATKYPGTKQHIIAHSHGGNVVLYSLRDEDICQHITSVVCLATPFIHAQKRPLEPVMRTLRTLVYSATLIPAAMLTTFLLVIFSIAILVYPEAELGTMLRSMGLPASVLIPGLILFWVSFCWLGFKLSRKLKNWINTRLQPAIEKYQEKLLQRFGHSIAKPVPVLNLQVKGDEAGWWLRALTWASEAKQDAASILTAGAMFALLAGGAVAKSLIDDGMLQDSFSAILVGVMIILSAVFLVWVMFLPVAIVMSHVIFIGMPLLFRAHGGGFGEWSIVANWMLKIDAQQEPGSALQLETQQFTTTGSGLHHSQIYQDDRVIKRIEAWLNKTNT